MLTLNKKQIACIVNLYKHHGEFSVEQIEANTSGFVFVFLNDQVEATVEIDTFGNSWFYGTNRVF